MSQLNRLLVDEKSTPAFADVNSLVEWESVRIVDILVDTAPICAICLDHVNVPGMLQCGHTFCLPCILLHFINASSCCVCSEYARPSDLRSVRIQFISPVLSGRMRTFQLTHTSAGISLPACGVLPSIPNQRVPGWWFSRIVSVSDQEVLSLHLSEKARITESQPDFDSLDGIHSFGTIQAIEFLDQRISSLGFISAPQSLTGPSESYGLASIDIDSLQRLTTPKPSPSVVYAYQLVDGQHTYLEPLWTRILLAHYSQSPDKERWDKIDALPQNISLPIVHTTQLTVDTETQKRYRHLNHLPIGTIVTLCDVDLRGIVTADILESMSAQIGRRLEIIRQVKNQRKNDKRDARKANSVPLSKEWGLMGDSYHMPPIPSQEEFTPLVDVKSRENTETSGPSYASLAAELSQGGFLDTGSFDSHDRHYKASEISGTGTEEEMLLEQYSRRASSQPVAEIESLLHQTEMHLHHQTASTPPERNSRKNNKIKLRIAG